MATARVGISGWRYPPWRGEWYPKGLPQRRELEYSSSRLNTIELNGSFYSLQRPQNYLAWYDETPHDFVFSVKGGRFITHLKRLNEVDVALSNFFASGVLALREKLGPILWQLPERHAFDVEQLERFFASLPRTSSEALALAMRHDGRLDGRDWLVQQPERPLRHALEARHPEFIGDTVAALLRDNDIAFVVADTAGRWPQNRAVTSDFVYVRLHGAEELYASGYTDQALDAWAADTRGWLDSGRDVYIYFDNDMKVRAPFDALSLAARLGIGQPNGRISG
ncbi:MAG: yecE [Glaciihabitans sp.]|nr:yecE [Glaciihabitans sp.]